MHICRKHAADAFSEIRQAERLFATSSLVCVGVASKIGLVAVGFVVRQNVQHCMREHAAYALGEARMGCAMGRAGQGRSGRDLSHFYLSFHANVEDRPLPHEPTWHKCVSTRGAVVEDEHLFACVDGSFNEAKGGPRRQGGAHDLERRHGRWGEVHKVSHKELRRSASPEMSSPA